MNETNAETAEASFSSDPVTYLDAIVGSAASIVLLAKLAGTTASTIKETMATDETVTQTFGTVTTTTVAPLYLRAVAQQLAAALPAVPPAAAAGVVVQVDMESEMKRVKQIYEIAEAVGHAVVHCTPRSLISQSGILPALANVLAANASPLVLSTVHVEFLQACIYAGEYRFAERCIGNSWPRPNATVSVRQVLRYFLLRGTIHAARGNMKMAVRCFWTCLSVPADIVSAVTIAAWKKLVLVQCLLLSDQATTSSAGPLSKPRATPQCIDRFLTRASTSTSSMTAQGSASSNATATNTTNNSSNATANTNRNRGRQPEDSSSIAEFTGSESAGMSLVAAPTPVPDNLGVKVYMELVQAFCKTDRKTFATLMTYHEAALTSDGNTGLVAQCQTELVRRQVFQVSRIYSTISLQDLSAELEMAPEQVQTLLLQVSIDKDWAIEMQNGMVAFPKLVDRGTEQDARDLEDLVHVTTMVQKLEVGIAASSKYISFARRENSKSGEGKGAPRGVEEL